MTRMYSVIVALVLAALVGGCRSETDYLTLKGSFEREQQLNQDSTARITLLEGEAKEAAVELKAFVDSRKLLEKDKDTLTASVKAIGEELSAARQDSEKAKQERNSLQEELNAAKGKIKEITNLVELKSSESKNIADAYTKTIDELKSRVEQLSTELADSKAQIEKLNAEAAEGPATKAPRKTPEKVVEPKSKEPAGDKPVDTKTKGAAK